MAEVDVVAEQEDEEQLADILLLLVAVKSLVTLELGPELKKHKLRIFRNILERIFGLRESKKIVLRHCVIIFSPVEFCVDTEISFFVAKHETIMTSPGCS